MSDNARRVVALVIQPDPDDPPDRLAGWFTEMGVSIELVRPFAGDPVPAALEHDALVILGGDMGAEDDERYPWLADIRRLLSEAVTAQTPTLGVCLGGQLLAVATGGTVTRGDVGLETGAIAVRPVTDPATGETVDDRVVNDAALPGLVGAMHRDGISQLPPGSVLLASSDLYQHQAYRIGPRAWGLQFHPEVTPERYAQWVDHMTPEEAGSVPDLLGTVRHFAEHDAQVLVAASTVVKNFAAVVCDAADEHTIAGSAT
jgi:GMP synthase (glutamine-hydrolysing)